MDGAQYLRLETIGRKSGKTHQVVVRYIALDNKIIVFPHNDKKQDWVANVLFNPNVKLYTNFGIFLGIAKLKRIQGVNHPILSIFTRKYGIDEIKKRYWGQTKYVEITIQNKLGNSNPEELYYGDLEAAFDTVAEHYDEHIFGNPVNSWLRAVSVGLMKQVFKSGDTVLEIGCGTGTETLSLASSGIKVVATDISRKMLDVLKRKAELMGLSDMVVPVHARAGEVKEVLSGLGYEKFDGAYSNYGAINTEPKLPKLAKDLRTMIKTGGALVLGVWNRYCATEILGYTLRFKPRMAVARFKNPVPIGKSRFCVTTYSYTPSEISKMFCGFEIERVLGVVVVVPPSNLTKYLPKRHEFLKKLDLTLGRAFPFNRLGDHFLIVMRKVR